MFFTIVCSVFSCLCSFPVVRAVITQGCQLHRASVLAVCKPVVTSIGLKAAFWFSREEFPEAWNLGRDIWFTRFWLCVSLRAQLYRTLLIYLLGRITPAWTGIRSSMTWQSYRFLLFRGVRSFRQHLKEIWWLKKNSECCNSPFSSPLACASAGTLCA